MIINAQTKIAAVLKQHPDALETIIKLSPDFKKLRNPILRKLMAGRTSISMAAKIGGVTPEDFFEALKPLGFETDLNKPVIDEKPERKPFPDGLKALSSDKIIRFDVRTMLADGADPLREIQQKVKELRDGEALNIINTFEPVPLIKLLEKQGFSTYVDEVADDQYETYFYKTGGSQEKVELAADAETSGDWNEILKKYEGKLQEVDVRHLEMPMPMMTILEALETLPEEKALYVHHKRIPVFLLTELRDRNFDFRINDVADGEVYLLIFKNND